MLQKRGHHNDNNEARHREPAGNLLLRVVKMTVYLPVMHLGLVSLQGKLNSKG